ncbi:MAG: septum formation initiator family protein [Candidatus Omnitrophica bacterium]|jgi:cell division protein FtsB|nr:septum formation initiator family protein [Candidatus Omnitrophota bacterium]
MAAKLLSIKYLKWLSPLILIAVTFLAIIIYFPNYAKLKQLKDENIKLSLEIDKLKAEVGGYEDKLKNLKKEPYLYEKIARDDLGVAKEEEIVIDIEE